MRRARLLGTRLVCIASADSRVQASKKIAELPALLRGDNCLNSWGFSIDDVVLLPLLRAFTCVKGVTFPPAVLEYLRLDSTQMEDFTRHAC